MEDIMTLMNSIWIPVLLGVLCAGYGIYLGITKDVRALTKRSGTGNIRPLLKNPDKYIKSAMYLMFFMALGCAVMVAILYLTGSDIIATIESITWFIIFAFLWKRNEDTNGVI